MLMYLDHLSFAGLYSKKLCQTFNQVNCFKEPIEYPPLYNHFFTLQ